MTLDHSAPAHNPPKPLSRRSSLCSQTRSGTAPTITLSTSKSRGDHAASVRVHRFKTQQHAESDAHANVCHSERERTAPTERIRMGRPDAFALLRLKPTKNESRQDQFEGPSVRWLKRAKLRGAIKWNSYSCASTHQDSNKKRSNKLWKRKPRARAILDEP